MTVSVGSEGSRGTAEGGIAEVARLEEAAVGHAKELAQRFRELACAVGEQRLVLLSPTVRLSPLPQFSCLFHLFFPFSYLS